MAPGRKEFNREIKKFSLDNRRDFPWRRTRNPYRILVSEVMLQQTQTSRVLPFYRSFLKKFPDFKSLASASLREVLLAWQGLGYNRRALYLKQIAEIVVRDYGGKPPTDPGRLVQLPGIGQHTAGAICAFAFNMPVPFIETNIRKTFMHFFFISSRVEGFSPSNSPSKRGRSRPLPLSSGGREGSQPIHDRSILELIEKYMDKKNPREWYYAVVDYGAHLGKTTKGMNARSAHYRTQSIFEGSRRQWRSRVLRHILNHKSATRVELAKIFSATEGLIESILASLLKEGVLAEERGNYSVHQ